MIERLAVGALILPASVLEVAPLPAIVAVLVVAWCTMAALDRLGVVAP